MLVVKLENKFEDPRLNLSQVTAQKRISEINYEFFTSVTLKNRSRSPMSNPIRALLEVKLENKFEGPMLNFFQVIARKQKKWDKVRRFFYLCDLLK